MSEEGKNNQVQLRPLPTHSTLAPLTFGQCTAQGPVCGCGQRHSLRLGSSKRTPSSPLYYQSPEAFSKPLWSQLPDTGLQPNH